VPEYKPGTTSPYADHTAPARSDAEENRIEIVNEAAPTSKLS
jgi:hypothetical protein